MRRVAVVAVGLAMAACASTGPVARAARAQQNTATALAFADLVYNRHDVELAFRLYVGPVYREHDPRFADGRDNAIKALTQFTHERYPELHADIKRTLAQGDLVTLHMHLARTAGEHSSGQGWAVVDLFRLEHGRIVEHWAVVQDVPATAANDNTLF